MPAEYLLLMLACVLVTLPLEFVLGARVYRRPRRLLLAVLPLLLIFYVWDAIAIARGHWDYSPAHTTGWLLPFAVPVEEVVFFIVIPLCGLLTWEAVGRTRSRLTRTRPPGPTPPPAVPAPESHSRPRIFGGRSEIRGRERVGESREGGADA